MRAKYLDETDEEYSIAVLGRWWYKNLPGLTTLATAVLIGMALCTGR